MRYRIIGQPPVQTARRSGTTLSIASYLSAQ